MRAVVQRVSSAAVSVDGQVVGQIGRGLLVYLGIAKGDGPADLDYICRKLKGLRVFTDAEGKMNLSLEQVNGFILLISQFTLYGDARKGNRPAFDQAETPEAARTLYLKCGEMLRESGLGVAEGVFQADMLVQSVNQGPVTILLDSHKQF